MVLETKGYDPKKEIKEQAAQRWVSAVNADGRFGPWRFVMTDSVPKIETILDRIR